MVKYVQKIEIVNLVFVERKIIEVYIKLVKVVYYYIYKYLFLFKDHI